MAEQAAAKAKEDASSAKKQREKEKKMLRKERARLRSIHLNLDSKQTEWPDWDVIETICNSMSVEELKYLCDQLEEEIDTSKMFFLINDCHKSLSNENQRLREERRQVAIMMQDKKAKEEALKAEVDT